MLVTGLRHVGKGTWSIPWLTLPMHPYVWDYSWPFLRQENALVAISEDALFFAIPSNSSFRSLSSVVFFILPRNSSYKASCDYSGKRKSFFEHCFKNCILLLFFNCACHPYVYNFLPQRKGVIYLFFPPFGLQAALSYPSRYSRHFGKLLKIWKVSFVQSQL